MVLIALERRASSNGLIVRFDYHPLLIYRRFLQKGLKVDRIIKVSKADLLKKLKANKTEHVKIYEDAMNGWRKKVQTRCGEISQAMKSKNDGVDLGFLDLDRPYTREGDYDMIIGMLEMDQDEGLVELDKDEYRQFVLDKWEWDAC